MVSSTLYPAVHILGSQSRNIWKGLGVSCESLGASLEPGGGEPHMWYKVSIISIINVSFVHKLQGLWES